MHMRENRRQLLGMKQALAGILGVWPWDAAFHSLWEPWLHKFPSGTRSAHLNMSTPPDLQIPVSVEELVWKSTATVRKGCQEGLKWAEPASKVQGSRFSLSTSQRKCVTRGCLPTDWSPRGVWYRPQWLPCRHLGWIGSTLQRIGPAGTPALYQPGS